MGDRFGAPPRPASRRLLVLSGAAALVAALLFWVFSDAGWRAAISFLAAAAGGGLLAIGGAAVVSMFSMAMPRMSLLIAMTIHLTTVAIFAAVLFAGDPEVIDATAFASGLVLAVICSVAIHWQTLSVRGPARRER